MLSVSSEDGPGSARFPAPSQKTFPEELEIKQNELSFGQPAEQVTKHEMWEDFRCFAESVGPVCPAPSKSPWLFCSVPWGLLHWEAKIKTGGELRTPKTFHLSFLSLHPPLLLVYKNEAVEQQFNELFHHILLLTVHQ